MVAKKKSSHSKPKSSDSSILILTGEHSGDLLGGDLLGELKSMKPGFSYYGIGGDSMKAHGFESLEDIEALSVIGFSEAIKKYSFLKRVLFQIVEEAKYRNTKLAILIDYPGFNLRLAKELKKIGIPSVFYVSPQIWAWKFKRIFFIKEHIELMLTLFRFEESIYKEYGVNAKFVGHPIVKRIPEKLKKESPLPTGLPHTDEGFVVGLLPGSRTGEITKLLDPILGTAVLLHRHITAQGKKIVFLLPNINSKQEDFIKQKLAEIKIEEPSIEIHYVWDGSLKVMNASDLLLIASGTATLEGLYFEKPMVILYKVSLFTYFIGSLLMKSKFIGLANILSGQEVCRELTQNECKPKYIFEEAKRILDHSEFRNKMIRLLKETKDRELGASNGGKLAAKEISHFIDSLGTEES
ncbi:lipid-A-disaccharide synthase [Leptospira kobayashii]|uniref:Lipid-A-disaccharide synthase n=1 Tax=Leptospira kobayashii TaxID=1917830 RepID=A0ABN6KHZ0_9LEPT|nr:lipid-A-disaccharide synthase [Leptospira kobayashii]BDA79257.1 lipid-A-disaccharide synthase [Leptospira kobayashii]